MIKRVHMTECNKQFNIFETFLDLFVICINIKNKENIQTDNLKQWKKQALGLIKCKLFIFQIQGKIIADLS